VAFDYVIGLDQPAMEGLSRHGRTQIYVTHDAGYWARPCASELNPR
jgi:hypothetical protein